MNYQLSRCVVLGLVQERQQSLTVATQVPRLCSSRSSSHSVIQIWLRCLQQKMRIRAKRKDSTPSRKSHTQTKFTCRPSWLTCTSFMRKLNWQSQSTENTALVHISKSRVYSTCRTSQIYVQPPMGLTWTGLIFKVVVFLNFQQGCM